MPRKAQLMKQGPLKDVYRIKGKSCSRAIVYCCSVSNTPTNYFYEEETSGFWSLPDECPFLEEMFDVYLPVPLPFRSKFYQDRKPDYYWWDWNGSRTSPKYNLPELAFADVDSWLAAVNRIHDILRELSSQYTEVHIGGISQGAGLALSAARYSPVPVAGILAISGTTCTFADGQTEVSMLDIEVLAEKDSRVRDLVQRRIDQTPNILQTYNGDADCVYPFFIAVNGIRRLGQDMKAKVVQMEALPQAFLNLRNGHDPQDLEDSFLEDYYKDAEKAATRRCRKVKMIESQEMPAKVKKFIAKQSRPGFMHSTEMTRGS
jgi:pimeloyl-ACP methyl ester carboxylesterase